MAPPPSGIGPFRAAQDRQDRRPPRSPGEAGPRRQLERQPRSPGPSRRAAARPRGITVDPLVADAGARRRSTVSSTTATIGSVWRERLLQQAEEEPYAFQARPCPRHRNRWNRPNPFSEAPSPLAAPRARSGGSGTAAPPSPGHGVQPRWPHEHRREQRQPSSIARRCRVPDLRHGSVPARPYDTSDGVGCGSPMPLSRLLLPGSFRVCSRGENPSALRRLQAPRR